MSPESSVPKKGISTLRFPTRTKASGRLAGGHLFQVLFLTAVCAHAAERIDSLKLSLKSEIDVGHVVKGFQSETGRELTMLPLNRNIVTIGTNADLNRNWKLEAGFRSVIWWPFGGSGDMPHERIVRVESELAIARLSARLSETAILEAGYFPYKYNRDAKNLGEYLHRSGTYPAYLMTTDNLILMNGGVPHFYGSRLQVTHSEGRFRHDLTLFTETEINPVGDFTPGYQFNLNFNFLELGIGAVYNHLLSFQPSKLEPNTSKDDNVYVEVTYTRPEGGDTTYAGPLGSAPALVREGIKNSTLTPKAMNRWTHKGIKAMGRISLDFGSLIDSELMGPEDLRLFAEAAFLGVENQPYFYDTPANRIPIMVGLNMPTFKLLDLLCLQVEKYTSPFINASPYSNLSLPIWKARLDAQGRQDPVTEDDWKWSIFAKKSVNQLFNIYVQVANDHLRTLRYDTVRSESPLTQDPSHWYYLFKLEFGI